MASLASPQSGDRPVFTEYAATMQKERAMLDEKDKTEGELKWLYQTLSHLALNSTNPSSDPTVVIVATAISESRKKIEGIVSDKISALEYFFTN